MARKRNTITTDMLDAAKRKGWSISQTARHYGTHHTTIGDACKRLGVELVRNGHIALRPCDRKAKLIRDADDTKKVVWSCKPEAIERALKRVK